MNHLKKFNESTKHHNRLTVEDIDDYFLEFLDKGTIKFYYNSIPLSQPNNICTTYIINRKFNNIDNVNLLNEFTELINEIGNVPKRWNLDFSLKLISIGVKAGGGGPMQTELTIKQPVPEIIVTTFPLINNPAINFRIDDMNLSFDKRVSIDSNMDFTMSVGLHTFRGGSGTHGSWLESDFAKYDKIENKVIEWFEKNFTIPSQFIDEEKEESLDGGDKRIVYEFKLLI